MAGVPFFVKPLNLTSTFYAVGNERASNPMYNLGEFQYAGMTWRSNGNANLYVYIDFGAAQPIDFVGMLGANAQSGTTFRVAGDPTLAGLSAAPAYDSTPLPFIAPSVGNRALYNSHLSLSSPQTYRFWLIQVGGHTGDFEAAFLVMGQKFQPVRYYEPEWEAGASTNRRSR